MERRLEQVRASERAQPSTMIAPRIRSSAPATKEKRYSRRYLACSAQGSALFFLLGDGRKFTARTSGSWLSVAMVQSTDWIGRGLTFLRSASRSVLLLSAFGAPLGFQLPIDGILEPQTNSDHEDQSQPSQNNVPRSECHWRKPFVPGRNNKESTTAERQIS